LAQPTSIISPVSRYQHWDPPYKNEVSISFAILSLQRYVKYSLFATFNRKAMKKRIIRVVLALGLIFGAHAASAQRVEVNALSAYMFGTSTDYIYRSGLRYGDIWIAPSAVYGGAVDITLDKNIMFEVQYMHQPTRAEERGRGGLVAHATDLTNHFVQAGGLYSQSVNPSVDVFGGVMFGLEVFTPSKPEYESVVRFLGTLTGGTKVWLTDAVGLRVQAALNMPMVLSGVGFYFGTGGADYGASTFVQLLQFNLGGGVVVRL
jgi:hypothetical protein